MAAIFQVVGPRENLQTSSTTSEYFSAFQNILEMACRRVDALRSINPELERRMLPRKKAALRAQCSGAWGASPCLISDFSDGGLAFVCGHLHGIGEQVRVSWYTAQGTQVEIECEVRHVTGANIGVRFHNMALEQGPRVVASLCSMDSSGQPYQTAA